MITMRGPAPTGANLAAKRASILGQTYAFVYIDRNAVEQTIYSNAVTDMRAPGSNWEIDFGVLTIQLLAPTGGTVAQQRASVLGSLFTFLKGSSPMASGGILDLRVSAGVLEIDFDITVNG